MLKCVESHYCRSKSQRVYLPAELNISKLFKMYNKDVPNNLKVKAAFFISVFNNHFKIGFGSPRTDMCSICLELDEQIKSSKDNIEKQTIMTTKRVHTLKAKAFYNLLREEIAGLKILSFNCQKNLHCPKLPDQSAYYSRHIYLYNFTIVEGTSKTPLNANNVYAYCWTENELAKSSNEIASAVYHRLKNTNLTGIEYLYFAFVHISYVSLLTDATGKIKILP